LFKKEWYFMHFLPNSYPDPISQLAADHNIPQEVPEILKALLLNIQEVLANNLVGVYLRGCGFMGNCNTTGTLAYSR